MKTDYYIYQTKRIMKIILCTPIFLPFLIFGLFVELLKFIANNILKITKILDRQAIELLEKGTWIDNISDWIHKT